MNEPTKLPSLADLNQDIEAAFKNDQLNFLLNQEPPAQWIKVHPLTKTKYLPIERVEFLLIKIFQRYSVEVVGYSQLFQSIAVHVRLKVENPIDGTFIVHDGLGAAPVQVDKDESPADLSKIKSAAVQMGLPSAESYAIKDAAEKLGKIFGRDLNRKDVLNVDIYEKMAKRWKTE